MNHEPDNNNWRKIKSTYEEIESTEPETVAKKKIDYAKWIHLGNLFITPAVVFLLQFLGIISDETTGYLMSIWLILILALFLLIPAYQGFTSKGKYETSVDQDFAADALTGAAGFVVMGVFLRIMYGCYQWLKDGYWEQLTLCNELNLMCFGGTDFVGINKIITEIGSSDFTFVGIGVAILLGLIGNACRN